jgi:hypothetical protein
MPPPVNLLAETYFMFGLSRQYEKERNFAGPAAVQFLMLMIMEKSPIEPKFLSPQHP